MNTSDMTIKSSPQRTIVPPEPSRTSSQAWPVVDRRSSGDRRQKPTSPWAIFFGLKRRQRGRRKGEEQNSFVDVYRKRDMGLLVAILVLNLLDAAFTLVHIQRGGREANPFMEPLLNDGDIASFLFQKSAVVGSLLLVLVVHKNFTIARRSMWLIFMGYLALFAYHIALQSCGVYSNY